LFFARHRTALSRTRRRPRRRIDIARNLPDPQEIRYLRAMSPEERRLRVDLAACYRVFDLLGWTEVIFNHITVRVPEPGPARFLINPYGLLYREGTASSLVKIDVDGNQVDGGGRVNPAGFVIHAAIHRARDDAHCIMHTHTTTGMAVACKERGLSADNFYGAQLAGRVAYHDFEGITVRTDEQTRLVAALGDKNVAILRHHGLLACGKTVEHALLALWTLQRACDVQCATDALQGETRALSADVVAQTRRDLASFDSGGDVARLFFDALVRRVRSIDASFES